MNSTTVVDMRQFVAVRDGLLFTTSQNVADAFGKLHKDVLRKIDSLECSSEFTERNFTLSGYVDGSGRRLPQWDMTKDGFMFLVMGFTGKKAATIKEGYIAAFNEMAMLLGKSAQGIVGEVVVKALGKEGALILSNVMRCRVAKLGSDHQRSATAKLASALHARFSVPRIELIPADHLDSACNFIAAYALEGEYMPHQPSHAGRLNIHFPIDSLTCRRPEMLTDRGNGHAWLDVKIADLRENFGSPCEAVLCELSRAGYDVTGAWWEVRTLRNKLQQVSSFITGLNRVVEDPQRYAVKEGVAA